MHDLKPFHYRRWAVGLLVVLLMTSCRTVPFDSTPRVPVQSWTPTTVRDEYADRLDASFEWRHAMTFEFPFFKMAALGVAAGDRSTRALTLVCFTHTGVTLFELQDDGSRAQTRFTIPEMEARPEIGTAIAEDARRLFFNWVPPPEARISRRRQTLVFVSQEGRDRVEYIFGGADRVLLEKRYRRGWRRLATVRFFEYREDEDGRLRPSGIVLHNRQRRYRLFFRAL